MKTIYILSWDGSCKYFANIEALVKYLKTFGSNEFSCPEKGTLRIEEQVLNVLIDENKANNMNTQLTINSHVCGIPSIYEFYVKKESLIE